MDNSNSFLLGISTELDFGAWQADVVVALKEDKLYLVIEGEWFEFSSNKNEKQEFIGFTASYDAKKKEGLNLIKLLKTFIPQLDSLPEIELALKDVVIAYRQAEKPNSSPTFLIGGTLDFSLNLADLPLVNKVFSADSAPRLDNFQISFSTTDISVTELDKLHIPSKYALANHSSNHSANSEHTSQVAIASGLLLSIQLNLGNEPKTLNLKLANPQIPTATQKKSLLQSSQITPSTELKNADKQTKNENLKDSITWIELNKQISVVNFQKIGFTFKNPDLCFFLNASLRFSGITLACQNLGVSISINNLFEIPKFSLDGIAICYTGSDFVAIGGAFLRKIVPQLDKQGKIKKDDKNRPLTYEEYSGAAILGFTIKKKKFLLTAIGSYAEINGESSLFIFAVLEYPLGGIPAFFVTGLAVGFGYNRRLNAPKTVEEVELFPLVKIAMGVDDTTKDLLKVLDSFSTYIQPASGEIFLAIGIKFTSFKIVNAFILLIVKLGRRTEIYILGLAHLIAPPTADLGLDPIAEAKLTLRAIYIPEEGFIQVEANLQKGSCIFSKNCYLQGGFAFYAWFAGKHEGDFVLTLGGYHPKFLVPDHYPNVPRLSLEWQLSDSLSVKGSAYFALTASALMAGGCLEMKFQQDNVQAYFKLEANFLISWQPFYYEASISLEIRVSAKILLSTISIDISASLTVWGPPFSGIATLEISCISVTIRFGANTKPKPKPLSWQEFKTKLLPAPSEICSISIADGLIKKLGQGKTEEWVMNAKELVLVMSSTIPATKTTIKKPYLDQNWNMNISMRPMDCASQYVQSSQGIEIKHNDNNVNEEFIFIPILKQVPSGLWGEGFIPDNPNGVQFIENALSGFTVRPAIPPTAGKSEAIAYDKLLLDKEIEGGVYAWQNITLPALISETDSTDIIQKYLKNQNFKIERNILLANLGFDIMQDVSIDDSIVDDFLGNPQIVESLVSI